MISSVQVVEICWGWKIDDSFLKRAYCFEASANRFCLGWFRFYLCWIGANNVSALIPPSHLDSRILWMVVIWAPGGRTLVLRFKTHEQKRTPINLDWLQHHGRKLAGCFSPISFWRGGNWGPERGDLWPYEPIQERGLHYTRVSTPQGANPPGVLCYLLLSLF